MSTSLGKLIFFVLLVFAHFGHAQSPWALQIESNRFPGQNAVTVGTIATPESICSVLDHAIFRHGANDYRLLHSVNSDFQWDGIEAAPLWVERKFKEVGVTPHRLYLDPSTFQRANDALATCLQSLDKDRAGVYDNLKKFFLHYLPSACYQQSFDVTKTVDDKGNIIEKRAPRSDKTCIDFNYNSGHYGNWNSTTFALMLIWSEAHPILQRVLDQGHRLLVTEVQRRDLKAHEERLAQQQRQELQDQRRREFDAQWQAYAGREKSVMEQVFNFATTGNVNGTPYERWTETSSCMLSNGRRQIDSRSINMTAFRVTLQKSGNASYLVSSDGTVNLSTSNSIPIDRLRNAWALAFKTCPGKTSRF